MGLLTRGIDVTVDGCVDHQEGIVNDETHAFFTGLMDESGAMLWGRITYEVMQSYWPAVARGDRDAPPACACGRSALEAKPKYVVSSTRTDFPWTNSHHIAGDLRTGVRSEGDSHYHRRRIHEVAAAHAHSPSRAVRAGIGRHRLDLHRSWHRAAGATARSV